MIGIISRPKAAAGSPITATGPTGGGQLFKIMILKKETA
jgi:hypothetical protein